MSADTDAGGDGSRRAPAEDPQEQELETVVEDFWEELDQLRQDRGSPSYGAIARRARLPRSTVAEWFKKRSVIPERLEFAGLIRALDGEPDQWDELWRRARSAYVDLKSRRARQAWLDRSPGQIHPGPPPEEDQPEPDPIPRGGLGSGPGADTDSGTADRADGEAKLRSAVASALSTIWKRLGRSQAQRVAVAAVLVVAVAIGVFIIVPKIWGSSSSEPNAATRLPLLRYQAPSPDRANFISPTEPGPPGWIALPPLGEVYAPNVTGDGLVPIYRYRCTNCGSTVYFLSRYRDDRQNFVLEGEAFRCFDPNKAPPGTRPLEALINNQQARIWAVSGTREYDEAIANGFKDPSKDGLPLCYIW